MQVLTSPGRPSGDEPVGDSVGQDVPQAPRLRVLLVAALGPLVIGYAVVAALLALVTLTAGHAIFSAGGVLLSAGPGWLAAYQVELGIGGHPLGMLPLLPTVGAVLLVARAAAKAVRRLRCARLRHTIPLIATISGAHLLFGLLVSLLSIGEPVRANVALAAVVPAVLSGLAATGGVLRRFGMPQVLAERLDPLALRGLRAGLLGLFALLAAGALTLTAATALSARTVSGLFEPSFGSSFGLFLLSVLYLPNAVVAAMSFVSGPGFSIGSLNVHLVGYRGGSVPGVPLLGGIPEHAASWWPALLVLPLAVGVLVGWSVRAVDDDPAARLRAVVVAGAVVGFGCVLLGTLAGGRLGDGPFDPVSVPVGVASIVAFCWIVIPAGFVAFFAGAHSPMRPVGSLEVEDAAEPETEPEDAEPGAPESDEDVADGEAEEDSDLAEEPGEDSGENSGDDEDFDAEADAELGLDLPEDEPETETAEAEDKPEAPAEEPEAVTESTEDSGDAKPAEDDR
ncbi:cell division protein PerM [Amycolatopsis sp. NPDC054798]